MGTSNLNRNDKTLKMVYISFFIALIVVLQMLAYLVSKIPFFPIAISLVFIPIIVGGNFFGKRAGTILGFAFGIITFIGCISGLDAGGAILYNARPIVTLILCVLKATCAGVVPALVMELLSKTKINKTANYVISSFIGPFVNTTIFCIGMAIFYQTTLSEWAGGKNTFVYIITGLAGFNFLFESISTMIVAPILINNLKGKIKL